jgi:cytochrome c oxidase cbb3-type subunit III
MRAPSSHCLAVAVAVAAIACSVLATSQGSAQQSTPPSGAAALTQVPVSTLFPGGVPLGPSLKVPDISDPVAMQRGMQYFAGMNCIGCHMANGGGGMGPALSDDTFTYGNKPENIFLSIYQGRPNGMPAWGAMLPPEVIWDIVAYVKSLSAQPDDGWGRTVSKTSPTIQQVPAELVITDKPWTQTQPFGNGRKP